MDNKKKIDWFYLSWNDLKRKYPKFTLVSPIRNGKSLVTKQMLDQYKNIKGSQISDIWIDELIEGDKNDKKIL